MVAIRTSDPLQLTIVYERAERGSPPEGVERGGGHTEQVEVRLELVRGHERGHER